MGKILRLGFGKGLGTAAILLTCLADGAGGQNTPPAPNVGPAIDRATLAQATAKGKDMQGHAKWNAELDISRTGLQIAGPALVCAGRGLSRPMVSVLDLQTGHTLWEMNGSLSARMDASLAPRLNAPLAWTENRLVHFVEADAQLSLWFRSADTPEGKAIWETKYDLPDAPRGSAVVPVATFAGQQIIAGEEVSRRGQSGGIMPGGVLTSTPLTIRSFDRKTGGLQWATRVPGTAALATVTGVAEGRVYVLVSETRGGREIKPLKGFVMGLNAADGKVLWQSPSGARPIHAAVQGSALVALAENGEVIAYDGQTGKEQWRTALSTECDPAKSKFEMASSADDRVYLEKEGLFITITKLPEESQAQPSLESAFVNSMEGGIAVLDPQTGKQTAYFNDKGITGAPQSPIRYVQTPGTPGNPIRDLHVRGDMLIVQVGTQGCIGVNRKTLKLEWFISAISSATADGVLYANTTGQHPEPTKLVAVPLDELR